ncbi:hypothetical protein NQ314_005988 [Rhamnusium bicolor]|uniref:Uncharacterized protein n=1 Tax=Rhamnusium bicolor TaxID=1586634 RepID=A0AAV8ZA04_9CUCU|nr:hypothetical protein NQ314_005988 [Rhamnusium bicolor]
MFSSPSVRLYTSENADNLVQRKPGNNLTIRKPFLDRSVNSKTPDTGKLLKPKLKFTKETATVEKPKKSPKEDLNADDFMFSYKDVEEDTPPPTPDPAPLDIDPIFFELPEVEMPELPDEDNLNRTFEVEIPELDYDDLDISF